MPQIKTPCTAETKAGFQALAARHGMTEAALLRQIVSRVVRDAGESSGPELGADKGRALGQIRLRLHDHEVRRIRELATPAGQSTQGWVVALIRERIEKAVPFAKQDLVELREAIREIGPVGRNLNTITHRLLRSDQWNDSQIEFVRAAADATEKVHRAVRNLAERAKRRAGAGDA